MITSVGSGVQQSSFYGLTAMLPHRFTMALMVGESTAGVLASFNRISTKASYEQNSDGLRESAFVFFYVSLGFLVACAVIFECVRRSAVLQHYAASSALSSAMILEADFPPGNAAKETRFDEGRESDCSGDLLDHKSSSSGYAPIQVFIYFSLVSFLPNRFVSCYLPLFEKDL